MVSLFSEALGFNGINVIVFQCLGGFFYNETKYSGSEYIAEYGCSGYVLYRSNQIVLQHPYPYLADD
jgi:hypothetical protein